MALNKDAIGVEIGPVTSEYGWKEVVLYALGVGAGFDELEYVYEKDLKVIPSFAVLSAYDLFAEMVAISGVNLAGLLHGEHDLIIHQTIPANGTKLKTTGRITHMYDKGEGRGALLIAEVETFTEEGVKLFTNIATLFARLDGGFGGEAAPSETIKFPDREPDFEENDAPSPDQPLLYRLSGDTFMLHVDPDFARASGFDRPIMHGLCTHGYACRAVIKNLFPGEPERLSRFRNRFSRPLYPGEAIKTQIWKMEDGKALFKTINAESGKAVIDRGVVEWISPEELGRRGRLGAIHFDGRVAIVTGAGGGLGRAYALGLAQRGAKVVVNDLGGAPDGTGKGGKKAADKVVKEIVEAGGEAVANYDTVATVEGGERIVQTALEHYGRVDILINNAGILRDKSFGKMTPEMWESVETVHLDGAFNVTKPAFREMRERGYGRIVMTTSAAGLFGNFGQTNYGAAKMGIVGMMNTLKLEGAKYNIQVNTVAPLAATRLTEDVMPAEFLEQLTPEHVAPLVLYLCSEECTDTGLIINAGGGFFGRSGIVSGPSIQVGDGESPASLGMIHQAWGDIGSIEGAQEYTEANAALIAMMTQPAIEEKGESPAVEVAVSVDTIFREMPQDFQPEASEGVDVVFQFNISGPGGGDWYVVVKDGECEVEAGLHGSPTTTIKMSEDDFIKYVSGELPAMQAYTAGKLKVEGDLMKSQLIEKLFKL
ncbi:MAG: SDR family NAD(P)-dependent oxidoreductase [Anaerolineales bacterium]|nr:SDR family NAD(P)-dependent oxidoreductase [Anaerolineales bacterium]